jgi:dihydrofolate synthase/folylpolyglutamate synthase
VPIAEDEFAFALGSAIDAAAGLSPGDGVFTEFELLTAAALSAFARAGTLWAVLEVGLGGRWDATSVVSPRVSVITGVGLDHMDRLGSTREEIAADKACIIKTGSVAVLGPGCFGVEQILLERAAKMGAPVVRVGLSGADVTWRVTSAPDAPGAAMRLDVDGALAPYTDLLIFAPSYQAPNVAVAIAAAEAALGQSLDEALLREALSAMTFPGRFELIRAVPPVVIDGAHNPEASAVLAGAVREAFGDVYPVFILGVMADKDAVGIVRELAPVSAGFVCTCSRSERAMVPSTLAAVVCNEGGTVLAIADSVAGALECAEPYAGAGLVVAGSIYVAGEARAVLSAQ